ncbi:32439_t:CDS:1, partial [Racocetra persica]
VKSVVDKMFDNLDNLGKFFVKIEDLSNELVLNYADKIFKKYRNTEQYLIFEKAQNRP